jgi:hypothetical protein
MKKMVYESPELMMDKFESEDVIMASSGDVTISPADCDSVAAESRFRTPMIKF